MYSVRYSHTLLLGVIGYQAATVAPPNIMPIAVASLPSIMILPSVAWARSNRNLNWSSRFALAHS